MGLKPGGPEESGKQAEPRASGKQGGLAMPKKKSQGPGEPVNQLNKEDLENLWSQQKPGDLENLGNQLELEDQNNLQNQETL